MNRIYLSSAIFLVSGLGFADDVATRLEKVEVRLKAVELRLAELGNAQSDAADEPHKCVGSCGFLNGETLTKYSEKKTALGEDRKAAFEALKTECNKIKYPLKTIGEPPKFMPVFMTPDVMKGDKVVSKGELRLCTAKSCCTLVK